MSQTKGRFEVHDLGHFKLHVYYTNDVLGDASYIVEGKDALGLQPCPYGRDLYRLVRPGNFCNTPAFFCFPPMRFSFVSSSSTRIIPIFVPINQLFDSETTQLKTKSMAIKANTSYLQGILSCPSVAGSFIVHFFRSFPAYLSIFKTNNLHIRCQLLPPPYALVSDCKIAYYRRLCFTSSVGVRHTPCVRMLPVPFLYLKIRPFLQSHSPGINRHKSVPYTPLGKAG